MEDMQTSCRQQNRQAWRPARKCHPGLQGSQSSGSPNPQVTDWYQPMAWQELGRTGGGEQQVSEPSFICIRSRSPALTSLPQPHLTSLAVKFS